MSTNTTNYDLVKPAATDFYDIEVMNENLDKIDTAIKQAKDAADNVDLSQIESDIQGIDQKVTQHLAHDTTEKHSANQISIAPISGMTATNVQEGLAQAFLLGNSRKEDLVDKLLLVDASLPISYSSTWVEVLNAISMISTGRKFITGHIATMNRSSSQTIPLDFTPNHIICYFSWAGQYRIYTGSKIATDTWKQVSFASFNTVQTSNTITINNLDTSREITDLTYIIFE